MLGLVWGIMRRYLKFGEDDEQKLKASDALLMWVKVNFAIVLCCVVLIASYSLWVVGRRIKFATTVRWRSPASPNPSKMVWFCVL